MLQKAICTMGEEAARMFYQPDNFTRKRAVPITGLMLLQDKGSAQVLDGAAHLWRKQMFMSLVNRGKIEREPGSSPSHRNPEMTDE
jgi:fatty-acid peroxygenase